MPYGIENLLKIYSGLGQRLVLGHTWVSKTESSLALGNLWSRGEPVTIQVTQHDEGIKSGTKTV